MNKNTLYTGALYDAMRFDLNVLNPFVLKSSIKPINSGDTLLGPAFTCKGEKVLDPSAIDDSIRIKMFEKFKNGCVQVISSGGFTDVAQFGDISGKIAKKIGAAGAVLDGPTRDSDLIRNDGFKLWCGGTQPIDAYGRWQITEFQVPITMPGIEGDVTVYPDDLIFADGDGIIVIPKDRCKEILDAALTRVESENNIRVSISKYDDISEMYKELGRW